MARLLLGFASPPADAAPCAGGDAGDDSDPESYMPTRRESPFPRSPPPYKRSLNPAALAISPRDEGRTLSEDDMSPSPRTGEIDRFFGQTDSPPPPPPRAFDVASIGAAAAAARAVRGCVSGRTGPKKRRKARAARSAETSSCCSAEPWRTREQSADRPAGTHDRPYPHSVADGFLNASCGIVVC